MMELLSPAGSPAAVAAAVQNGANAVYLGFGQFNARRNAKNFSPEAFASAISYCHLHGVKVYLTLNTLLTDRELSLAAASVQTANALGADAILVQDLGALRMIRQIAPDLPIHASTQMSIHNLDGVKKAAELGISRVVLARELSKKQISHICANAPIEIEVFVHGALCMCYSGQCYLSSVIGGRSGNRGLCAQPCRLPYGFHSFENKYPLSLKDMSLVNHLKELQEMGVACIKIEGRMKRPEYVAVVTSIYAKALRTGEPPSSHDLKALETVFSREGFTDGYLIGKTGRTMFGIRKSQEQSVDFQKLSDLYETKDPQIFIHMSSHIKRGAPCRLEIQDEDGHTAIAEGSIPESAIHKALTVQQVETNLQKTGGTPYACRSIQTQLDEGLSLPISAINALRRKALEELTRQRVALPSRRRGKYVPAPFYKNPTSAPGLIFSVSRIAQLTEELLQLSPMLVYLPLSEAASNETQVKLMLAQGISLAVVLPRIVWDEELPALNTQLDAIQAYGIRSAVIGNLGQLSLLNNRDLALRGDFGLNVFNSDALEVLRDLGLQSVTASFELRMPQIRDLSKCLDVELLVYGRLPLMITENCMMKANHKNCICQTPTELVDRTGARFPIVKDSHCRNVLLNSQILFLGDKRADYASIGLWGARLSFTTETPEDCVKAALWYTKQNKKPKSYTRGLYYREVE